MIRFWVVIFSAREDDENKWYTASILFESMDEAIQHITDLVFKREVVTVVIREVMLPDVAR